MSDAIKIDAMNGLTAMFARAINGPLTLEVCRIGPSVTIKVSSGSVSLSVDVDAVDFECDVSIPNMLLAAFAAADKIRL